MTGIKIIEKSPTELLINVRQAFFIIPLDSEKYKLVDKIELNFEFYKDNRNYYNLIKYLNIKTLILNEFFNEHFSSYFDKLEYLKFGNSFNKPLGNSFDNLIELKHLIFGNSFNQPLGNSLDNLKELTHLIFCKNFNQEFGDSLDKLSKLEFLGLDNDYPHSLDSLKAKHPDLVISKINLCNI